MDNQLKQELAKIEIPTELHERSKLGIKKVKTELGGRTNRFVKKRLTIAVAAACFIIPTSAFAYQALLADDLYGSFDNLKRHVASATMETYLLFDAKLNQAQGELGKEQYNQFKDLLHVFTSAKLEYGDKNGNIDYSQIPSEKVEEIKRAMYEIQPYFDKLNELPSSKEILTAEEYENYIQALMTYETIIAQSGIEGYPEIEMIPAELQEEFLNARQILSDVDEKQRTN